MKTKEKIIKNALSLFVEKGIDNTPTAQITKESGFSEATLFVHFKNKQGLIDAVYIDSKNRQKQAFGKISFTKEDAEQSLTNLYTAGVKYFTAQYEEAQFLQQVIDSSHISSHVREEYSEESQIFIETFNFWKKKKIIKDLDFDFYDKIVWSAIFDMTRYCREKGLKKVPKKLQSILWDTLRR